MSPGKEVAFFSDDDLYALGRTYYESFFADHADEPVIGEATPAYHYVPGVPERMHPLVPDAKLVFSLRDPIERAYSAYRMQIWKRAEDHEVSFLEAIRKNPRYLDHGRYAEQLVRYYRYFQRKQILIVWFDDLRQNPARFYNDICAFLSIDRFDFENTGVKHTLRSRSHGNPVVQSGLRTMRSAYDALGRGPLALIVGSQAVKKFSRGLRRSLLKKLTGSRPPPLPPETPRMVLPMIEESNNLLEQMTGRDLSTWNS